MTSASASQKPLSARAYARRKPCLLEEALLIAGVILCCDLLPKTQNLSLVFLRNAFGIKGRAQLLFKIRVELICAFAFHGAV